MRKLTHFPGTLILAFSVKKNTVVVSFCSVLETKGTQ